MNTQQLVLAATEALTRAHLHIHLEYGKGGLIASSIWLDDSGGQIALGQGVPRRCVNCPSPTIARDASRRFVWGLVIHKWDKLLSGDDLEAYESLMTPRIEEGLLAIPTRPTELDVHTDSITSVLNGRGDLVLKAKTSEVYYAESRPGHHQGVRTKSLWSDAKKKWLLLRMTLGDRVMLTK